MTKPKFEPEIIIRSKPSPLEKLYKTKKFKMEWAEFQEVYKAGKKVGYAAGEKRLGRALQKAQQRISELEARVEEESGLYVDTLNSRDEKIRRIAELEAENTKLKGLK